MRVQDAIGLPALLPYEGHDGEFFVQVDGSVGAAWEIERLPAELASEEELGGIAGRLAALFRRLPEGAVCQVLMSADRRLEEFPRGTGGTKPRGLFSDLARASAQTMRSFRFSLPEGTFRARRLRTCFTLRIFPGTRLPPFWLYGIHPQRYLDRVRRSWDRLRAEARRSGRTAEDLLTQLNLRPRALSPAGFREFCFELLNPARKTAPPLREGPLREQMLFTHVNFDSRTGVWELDGVPHALVSITELPRETACGMLRRVQEQLPEGLVAMNIEVPDQMEIQRALRSKKRLAFCQDRSGEADLISIRSEIDEVLGNLFAGGHRAVRARIHLWIRSAEALDEAASSILNTLHGLGFGAVREGPLALTLALQCLPLAYDPRNDRALKRARTLEDVNLAHLCPLYGAYKGSRRCDLPLLNREGEIVSFSFFDTDVAPHGIICGVSGSGKSVLSNNLILHARRRDARVFVLDRGRSYERMAKILGGRFVRFDRDLCINPCGRTLEGDKLMFLTDFFSEMATAGRADLPLRERSLLAQALRAAFARATSDVTVSDVCRELGRFGHPAARDLAESLKLYTRDGPYGALFDGPAEVDPSNPLTVFELERVALNKEVASVVLMAVLQRITDACMRDPREEKLLLIDEAWTLLQSPATARFLENVFRTYRKYRACAVMVTQQVADFEGPAGAAIRANAPNRCYLRQTPETILAMERLLDLKPPEKAVLSTLRTVKGAFSEILILTPRQSGVARLVQDPMTYWMTTTDPEDLTVLRKLEERSEAAGDPEPLRRALQMAASRYPRGVQGERELHE